MSYTAIASQTLGSSASSVTFSSIPGTFRDLVLVCNFTASSSTNFWNRYNGDTGSNYNVIEMGGNSGGAFSSSGNFDRAYIAPSTVTGASIRQQVTFQVQDYSTTDKHKSALVRQDSTGAGVTVALATRWANTSAITSIVLGLNAGNFEVGSVFSLYGIAA